MNALTVAAGACLAAIATTGAWLDIRHRRLPNWLCAAALLAGIGFGLALGGWAGLQMALLHVLVALVAGVGLYALGGIGAGDAKYYAALAVWFPLHQAPLLIGVVSLAGLALLIAWLPWRLRRRRRRRHGLPNAEDPFDKLPYGVAISLGALIAFALTR